MASREKLLKITVFALVPSNDLLCPSRSAGVVTPISKAAQNLLLPLFGRNDKEHSVADDVLQENAALASRGVVPEQQHRDLKQNFDINLDTLREHGDQLEAKNREYELLLQANAELWQYAIEQQLQLLTLRGGLQSSNTSDSDSLHEQDAATVNEELTPLQREKDLTSSILGGAENLAPNTTITLVELPDGLFPIPTGSLADVQLQLLRDSDVTHEDRVRTQRTVMDHLETTATTLQDLKVRSAASKQSERDLQAQLAQSQQATASVKDALRNRNTQIATLQDQLRRLYEWQDYGNEQFARANALAEEKRQVKAELAEIRAHVRLTGPVAMVNVYAYYC